MAETRASIEERLSQLVQESTQKSCWEKIPVKILVIALWVALAGVIGVCGYYFIRWQFADKNIQEYKDKSTAARQEIKELEKLKIRYTAELAAKKENLKQINGNITICEKNITDMQGKISDVQGDIKTTNTSISDTEKLIDGENKRHTRLVDEDSRVQKALENVTKLINDKKAQLLVVAKQLSIWKFFSGISFFGSALAAVNGFTLSGELAATNRDIQRLKLVHKYYPELSVMHENYVYLSRNIKKSVVRKECYRWRSHGKVANCYGKNMSLVTVSTIDGYRFGVETEVAWKSGWVEDEHAFGFSDYYVKVIGPKTQRKVNITANENEIKIGTTDIVLNLNTGEGSTLIETFLDTVAKGNFFHPNANFIFDDLIIETIEFSQQP
eukprot:TRINITY_DN3060_c0_g1_i5.p1 TRINITY_DN3060_c0_g1~~TRINITY_DN3060_c0_g1_i5.p1  ORF type:complete len:384 (+),score=102.95 TRINITY_DN3060_c0_g1_i5:105-1256(+)